MLVTAGMSTFLTSVHVGKALLSLIFSVSGSITHLAPLFVLSFEHVGG